MVLQKSSQFQTFCTLTSDISPHMDLLGKTVNLRVSVRPLGWQKPFREKNKSVKTSPVPVNMQNELP